MVSCKGAGKSEQKEAKVAKGWKKGRWADAIRGAQVKVKVMPEADSSFGGSRCKRGFAKFHPVNRGHRGKQSTASMQTLSRRALLNYVGLFILIAGMGTAEVIYWRSLHQEAGDFVDSPYDSRVFEQTMERTVGVFGLLMDEWSRGVAKLEEPKPLAITIAVVSMMAAGGCFFVASRMEGE